MNNMHDISTTIAVSKEFREWLKSRGTKGESYEDIIKKLLRPEVLQEYSSSTKTSEAKPSDMLDEYFDEKQE